MILGIDFGTTNTVISYFEENQIKLFKLNNNYLIPSKIYIDKNNNLFYGHNINNNLINNNGKIINNFKIELSLNKKYHHNNIIYSTHDILFNYINYISDLIHNNFEKDIFDCVLTVPSNFNSNNRNLIKNIFEKLKFNVIRIINEPTAAALYYELSLNNLTENKILIIDIGGGTTDLTILEKDEELYEVNFSIGDNNLGGKNITDDIFNYFKDLNYDITWETCEKAKIDLSKSKNVIIYGIELTDDILKKICENTIQKFKYLFNKIIKLLDDVNEIILVGGCMKLKLIKILINDIFNKKIIDIDNSQSLVSKGACFFTNYLKSKNDIIVMELVQNSIGIETADKIFSIIIPSGLPLPAKKTRKYIKTIDDRNDDKFEMKIYQGENNIASNNELIYIIDLRDYDSEIILVTVSIDINNLLELRINNNLIKNNLELNNNLIEIKEEKDLEISYNKNLFIVKQKLLKLLLEFENNKLIDFERKKNILNFLNSNLRKINNFKLNDLIKLKKHLETNFY